MRIRHPYDDYNILTFKTIAYDPKTNVSGNYTCRKHSALYIYDYSGILDIFNEISDFEKETKTNKDLLY